MKISVSVIGFNDAADLARCLASVSWADEVVYVDCGSTDGSMEIALRFNARIFKQPNDFNINVNKQFGLDQCSGDWTLYLDPDEEIPALLAQELKVLPETGGFSAFNLPRKNFYFGRWLKYGGKYPDQQLRFFKKGEAFFPCKSIHEKLSVAGKVGRTVNAFNHYPYKGVDDLLKKMGSYSSRKSAEYRRSGKLPGPVRPFRRFLVNYFLKRGFLDGLEGLIAALTEVMDGFLPLLKYSEENAGGSDRARVGP